MKTEEEEDIDDMATQLNPDAKEFVPVSPTRTGPMNNIFSNFMDSVVAQSPMKGDHPFMEDTISVPSESMFDNEAEVRPHELEDNVTEFMNLKEAMQRDDKLEQEYKDETQNFQEDVKNQTTGDYQELEKSFNDYSNGFQNTIDDPMNRSFYEGRDNDLLEKATQKDILNSCQPIPTFEDEHPEADSMQNGKIETSEFIVSHDEILPQQMVESLDNFEPEKFVEEIKKANGDVDKYTDQGLSPTIEISPAVEEPVIVSTPAVVEQQPQEIIQEPAVIIPDPVAVEKVVEEVAKVSDSPAAIKKPTTATPTAKKTGTPAKPSASLTSVKKTPTSAVKSPAVSKSPATTTSKVDVKAKAPVPKVPLTKKPATSTTSAAPKPATSTLATSRPKTTVSTTSAIKKTTSTVSSSVDKPAAKSSTLVKKTTTTVSSAPK